MSSSRYTFDVRVRNFILCLLLSMSLAAPAHALDKRLKLMFKTAAYGAAGGLVIGGATAAMGIGDARNMFMGASSGMYAGILLAAYIIATPPDHDDQPAPNPYSPKKPTNSSDWKDGEWDEEEYQKKEQYSPDNSRREELPKGKPQALVWMPVLSFKF